MSATPLAYSIKGAADAIGRSPSFISRAIKSGELRAKSSKVDEDGNSAGVLVITHDALTAFIDGLVDA